jgi:hypothetical protein
MAEDASIRAFATKQSEDSATFNFFTPNKRHCVFRFAFASTFFSIFLFRSSRVITIVNTRFISANTFRALQTRRRVFHGDTRFIKTRTTLTGKVDQYIVTIDFESKTNTTLLLMRHDKCKQSLFETKRSRKRIVLRL